MKIKLFNILLFICLFLSLVSCVNKVEEDDKNTNLDDEINDNNNDNENKDDDDDKKPDKTEGSVEFKVSLYKDEELYIPKSDEIINVIWADDFSQYEEKIQSDGYAKLKLDGKFNIYLENTPKDYTYNPNIYVADNDNPEVKIELIRITRISKGQGTETKPYNIDKTGTFNCSLTKAKNKIFYHFQPNQSGTYVIESMVNIHENMTNPKIDTYNGTFAAKWFDKTIDDGGAYKEGGYTKNFKWVVNLAKEQIGGLFIFAIHADSQAEVETKDIIFSVSYYKDYVIEHPTSVVIRAKELEYAEIKEDYTNGNYTYINSDGGTGSYYTGVSNGTGMIKGENFKYNPETKVWHVYDKETDTFGPKLCAKISAPCAYYDDSLNMIESHGNKDLTVSNGTENYKHFIEIDYASICNADGVCYVTMELKEFLQKFSNSQLLFLDGNGFVEMAEVFALEPDQWLFACGYYEENTNN